MAKPASRSSPATRRSSSTGLPKPRRAATPKTRSASRTSRSSPTAPEGSGGVKLAGLSLYRYELLLSEPVRLKETTLRHREGLLVELASDGGAAGWGEAAPLPGFSYEGLDEVARQLRHLADSMVGREATVDPEGAFARELDTLDLVPSARFGFELALWDLY